MENLSAKRLECLDGLRGVLAVYVMIGHMAPFAALPRWLTGPLSHGGAAVDMFFILSGLVIFRSLESCRFAPRPFLIARAARIFPVFLVMFAVGVAVQPLPAPFAAMPWIGPDGLARDIWSQGWPRFWMADIAAHLTMTHGLFPAAVLPDVWVSFLGAAWSLSTEWQFYVLALLLGRAGLGMARMAGAFLILAAAGLVWDLIAPEAWRFSRAFLPNKAHYFALGIASASLGGIAGASQVAGRMAWTFGMVLAAVLALSMAHGGAAKALPPLAWTVCLAAQLGCSPRRLDQVSVPPGYFWAWPRLVVARVARNAGRPCPVVPRRLLVMARLDRAIRHGTAPGWMALTASEPYPGPRRLAAADGPVKPGHDEEATVAGEDEGTGAKPSPPLSFGPVSFRPSPLSVLARPLRWRGVQYLGLISYPIYLANEPIQKALGFWLARLADGDGVWFTLLWLPSAIALPLGAAVLLHRYVEAPALAWGRRLIRSPENTGLRPDRAPADDSLNSPEATQRPSGRARSKA